MATETTTYQFRDVGAEQTAAAFKKVGGEIHATARHTQDMTSKVGGLGSGTSALGTVLSRVSPQFSQFAGVLGTAAGATSGLATAIGGIPGLVAGGLVAAVGIYATSQAQANKETEEAARALRGQASAVEELTAAFAKLGSSQIQAQLQAVNQVLELGTPQRDASGAIVGRQRLGISERERLLQVRQNLENRLERERNAALLAEIDAAASGLETQKDPRAARRSGSATAAGVAEFTDQRAALDQALQDAKNREAMLTRIAQTQSERRIQLAVEEGRARREQSMLDMEQWKEDRRQETEAYLAQSQQVRAQQQQLSSMGIQAAQGLAGAAINIFQQVAKGQELTGAAIVAMVGDQLVAMGSSWIFQGIANTILGNPQGPALIGVGSAAVVAGGAMGAASGGGVPSGGGAGAAAARPTPMRNRSDRRDEGGTTVIHVNALMPDDESVIKLANATRATNRRRGDRAARFAQ